MKAWLKMIAATYDTTNSLRSNSVVSLNGRNNHFLNACFHKAGFSNDGFLIFNDDGGAVDPYRMTDWELVAEALEAS